VDVPTTRYVRSGELAIAYQVHGSGDHDLLFNGGTASNIETIWRLPKAVRLFERLGRFARVIRYDRRDSGLSDPIKDDLTLEAHAADALAVIEAVGARRPVLVGGLDGSRSLALLAATRPERVRGLIALAPTACGTASSTAPEVANSMARAIAEIEDFPGRILALYAPKAARDPVLSDRLARYVQTSVTPRQAERLLRLSLTSDISEALPLVQAPTLVLRPRDLAMVPAEACREFADLIPGRSSGPSRAKRHSCTNSTSNCSRTSSRSS
jgi:pimeloyl-ACP methyl ester carboxylesterase